MIVNYSIVCLLSLLSGQPFVDCWNVDFAANSAFVSIWNAPSDICEKRYGISLNLSYFDIVANSNDTFEGNEIVIFYKNKLGLYPWIDATGSYIDGGLPQLSNMDAHLAQLSQDITKFIPDSNFTGLAIIDWEDWRPIFDRNGYNEEQKVYIRESMNLVRNRHPGWPEQRIESEARKEFEFAARNFMESTLKACRKHRRVGYWGFYGFPNCYNNRPGQKHCTTNTMALNDRLGWLFQSSTSLFPSIYLKGNFGTHDDRYNKVYGVLKETLRVKEKYGGKYAPIVPYTRYNYGDTGHFYDIADLNNTIRQVAEAGINGVALWDSSASFQSAEDCATLRDFLGSTLGPFVRNVTRAVRTCSEQVCNSHGRCAKTNWRNKVHVKAPRKVNILAYIFEQFMFKIMEKLLDIGSSAYRNIRRKIETRTYSARDKNYATERFPRLSCTCFKDWAGKFCQTRRKP